MKLQKNVSIIQTVNYIEKMEHAEEIYCLISNTSLDGLRINLCKYQISEICQIIQRIVRFFYDKNIKNIYLDIPYPIDKARVCGIFNRKDIKKGDTYIIKKYNNKILPHCKCNDIFVNCSKFELISDIIFYGDGQGMFKVVKVNSEKIYCVALNDFYIINGKSISCGYFMQDIKILFKILSSIGDMNVGLLIPFVENAEEIRKIKSVSLKNVSIIAKIETDLGLENIESIADESDGILIGRGDLALHADLKNLMINIQSAVKRVNNKKIIVCTGVLQNYNSIGIPDRAELFDVLLIKWWGVDEIILSGTSDLEFNNIHNTYSQMIETINRKVKFIKYVW